MIQCDAVTKCFGRVEVLKALDLTIERGHRVALVGSNGAGKTTLIRCLLGEYRCDGRITIDGLNPRAQRTEVLAKVGFVPQLPPPLKMPVGQLLRFAAGVCDADPQRMVHCRAKVAEGVAQCAIEIEADCGKGKRAHLRRGGGGRRRAPAPQQRPGQQHLRPRRGRGGPHHPASPGGRWRL